MPHDQAKQAAAEAALQFIEDGMIVGVGSGSTVNCFIDALARIKHRIEGAVSSSSESARRLQEHGIEVFDLNAVGPLALCVDGADECNPAKQLIKGGGAALTREKIVAAASKTFLCIIDVSKQVDVLGRFPLPVEVIPLARSLVARKLVGLGGQPEWRKDFVTDNGNWILDVHNMDLVDPLKMEQTINNLAGVVTCGIFAIRPADLVLVATGAGIKQV